MIIFCLSKQTLQVPSEETVFEAVISWIKQDEMKRKDLLPKMLEFVRLPLLTPRYLTDIVDSEASILNRFAYLVNLHVQEHYFHFYLH